MHKINVEIHNTICNGIQNCPLTFLHQKSQCSGSQGLGYSPIAYVVWLLWTGIPLVLSPTDFAHCMTSNASSQTSCRWHVQCDVTTYITPFRYKSHCNPVTGLLAVHLMSFQSPLPLWLRRTSTSQVSPAGYLSILNKLSECFSYLLCYRNHTG